MQRAIGRAYKRLRGSHPRRPSSDISGVLDLACDVLLAVAALFLFGGPALVIWAALVLPRAEALIPGFILTGGGLVLLYLWDKLAWAPFVKSMGELS